MLFSTVPLVALASLAAASVAPARRHLPGYDNSRVGPDNADCTRKQFYLDNVASMNVQFPNASPNANDTVLTFYLQEFISSFPAATNFSKTYTAAPKLLNRTYSISGTICYPKANKVPGVVQYLIHGIGFDSSYWDFSVSEEYSYVRAAAAAGYTTFRFDRLGTGNSEHPEDAYNIVQGPTDLAIATRLAAMLRNGGIDGTTYSKIVGVGHSYGAVQVEAITATVPAALDAVILQGYSANLTAAPLYLTSTAYSTATEIFPERFPKSSGLTNAYLVTESVRTNQLNFFYYPYYSQAAFKQARATEQPVTQGVLFTFGGLGAVAKTYSGPVLVATGDHDWIFCLNSCYNVPTGSNRSNILEYVKDLYPMVPASKFSTYVPANTGHAVNQHLSAPEIYKTMLAWAKSNL